jgi:hypothetical protein
MSVLPIVTFEAVLRTWQQHGGRSSRPAPGFRHRAPAPGSTPPATTGGG